MTVWLSDGCFIWFRWIAPCIDVCWGTAKEKTSPFLFFWGRRPLLMSSFHPGPGGYLGPGYVILHSKNTSKALKNHQNPLRLECAPSLRDSFHIAYGSQKKGEIPKPPRLVEGEDEEKPKNFKRPLNTPVWYIKRKTSKSCGPCRFTFLTHLSISPPTPFEDPSPEFPESDPSSFHPATDFLFCIFSSWSFCLFLLLLLLLLLLLSDKLSNRLRTGPPK